MAKRKADYDTPWKEVLTRYFPEFLAFFYPDIYDDIDWSQGWEFLDKELLKADRDGKLGSRVADKLAKVCRKDGKQAWVLAHVEVQAQEEEPFPRRMYIYNYRIFDLQDCDVASLAVLADPNVNWRPETYARSLWGCDVSFRFRVVKLTDWESRWEELEKSTSPFAVVVMAHLKALATARDPQERYRWKRILIGDLYRRGFAREDIRQLLRFIDWVMVLPVELETKLAEEVREYEEERMPYVTSWERMGREDGMLLEARESVLDNLQERFAQVPDEIVQMLLQIQDAVRLRKLRRQALRVASIDEFRKALAQRQARSRKAAGDEGSNASG